MSVYDWSVTSADNATADPNINWQEGQDANTVNDSARAMMAALAAEYRRRGGDIQSTGGANTYAVASPSGHEVTDRIDALVRFRAHQTNTGAATFSLDGSNPLPIWDNAGAPLTAGAIETNRVVTVVFRGSHWRMTTQPSSPAVEALSALTLTANRFLYTDGPGSLAEASLSTYGRNLLAQSDAAAARSYLGLGSLAASGTVNNNNWSGTPLSIANGGTGGTTPHTARVGLGLGGLSVLSTLDNSRWSGTDLSVANGGTGASDAASARANLGVGEAGRFDVVPVSRGGTGATGTNQARINLGLGGLSIRGTVNNDFWSGADLSVANGGTGASSAAAARANLGVIGSLAQSLAANGYVRFDGPLSGLKLQWGQATALTSNPGNLTTVTYPVAHSSWAHAFADGAFVGTGAATNNPSVSAWGLSNFTVFCPRDANVPFRWFSIGV